MAHEYRVALVTGGASGIGAATASRLAAEGFTVCVVDIDRVAADDMAGRIGGLAVACDVSDPEQVDRAFAICMSELGRVDVVLLNAGVSLHWSGDIGSLDLGDYRRSVGVNVDGTVFGMRAAVRSMRVRPDGAAGGVIVVTASTAGLDPWLPDPVYTLGKHAVIGLVRAVAPSLALEGLAVHAICPGFTQTGMLAERGQLIEQLGVAVADPSSIADAVVGVLDAPIERSGSAGIAESDKEPWAMQFASVPGSHNKLNVPVRPRRDT